MGCDAPAAKAGWELVCWRCKGIEAGEEENVCPECRGRGRIPQTRCPNAILSPEGKGLFLAYRRFKMYGVLPASGGLYAQAAIFLNTLELCDGVIAYLDRKQAEWNEWLRKKAGKRNQDDE